MRLVHGLEKSRQVVLDFEGSEIVDNSSIGSIAAYC